MLAATRLLCTAGAPFALRCLACRAVGEGGGADDAAALLERMLAAPDELVGWALMKVGTRASGEALLRAFVADGALRAGAPEVVLHALGYLGVEEAEPVLWAAARARDYGLHQSACLGLIDLACVGREAAIADEIRGCHGKNLFGEFWPALAGKVGDPGLIAPLYAAGAATSTDCFGGVLLGLALLGERAAFERVLFDPLWEAVDGATGNRRWSALGVRILGLSICALHRARMGRLGDPEVEVLAALVHAHATSEAFPGVRAAGRPADDDLALYRECFGRSGALEEAAWRRDIAQRRDGGRAAAIRRIGEARAALEERLTRRLQARDEEAMLGGVTGAGDESTAGRDEGGLGSPAARGVTGDAGGGR